MPRGPLCFKQMSNIRPGHFYSILTCLPQSMEVQDEDSMDSSFDWSRMQDCPGLIFG